MEEIAVRYVLSLRNTGLGDRLICLCAAWKYARDTGRTLVVDWRDSIYARGERNLFNMCFEPTPFLAGVPLIVAEGSDTASLPRPIWPKYWEDGLRMEKPFLASTDGPTGERTRSLDLIHSARDVSEPTVVFRACVNDGISAFEEARDCLTGLQPIRKIREAVETFVRERLSPRSTIGLHVRHGNGGDILNHTPYWSSFPEAIARCKRAIRYGRDKLGSDAPVFLATDSAEVEEALVESVWGIVVRPKSFREPGAGELHYGPDDETRVEDALAEMLLLSNNAALIRYPPASFFSFYAAIMKPTASNPPTDIDQLQQPFDKSDPLSPAVLF